MSAKPPLPVDDGEDEEVTAVTHQLNELKADAEACQVAANRAIRAVSATPPKPMPAVRPADGDDEEE